MNEPEIDVLISGAGAAGLSLAIELARRNVSFRLIDKLERPFSGSRGKGIQPRTLEVFADMGIADRIVAAGGAYPPERQYGSDGRFEDKPVFETVAATPAEPFTASLMLPQFLTESILRERLLELGHRPEFAHELKGFSQDGDGVVATIAGLHGEETVRARYLVGTDGGRSFVRHALETGFPGKTLGVRAIVADVTATGASRDVWHRFNEGDMTHQISLCPLAGTDLFQVQGPIPLEGDIDLSAAGLSALFSQRTGRSDIVIQSVFWASAYTMNARLADRYRKGRVFLAGDAAHTHPPTGGRG
jgi:2-polyprenyl-6-methoxyphenol hydroxylase-like FAD-dependent oxidoreductase